MDLFDDLEHNSRPVIEVATIFVGALVCGWAQELCEQVAMGTVHFEEGRISVVPE